MMKVFIADDEAIVREGLKNIIDWEELNFTVCGEGTNGLNTLEGMLKLKPDLVLLDIHMPKLHGIDVAKQARAEGFQGRIIILSGYSDFKYAQDAIRCGVDYYLTKPVDEDELLDAVKSIQDTIIKEQQKSTNLETYREKAKYKILRDMMQTANDEEIKESNSTFNFADLNLDADSYRIIVLDSYHSDDTDYFLAFCKLLRVPAHKSRSMEHIQIDKKEVVILKGATILSQFTSIINTMETDPKNPAYATLFIAAGRVISKINDIYFSYHDALFLLNRRFFCKKHQHILTNANLPNQNEFTYHLNDDDANKFCNLFYQYIQTYNRKGIEEALDTLQDTLFYTKEDSDSIKSFMIGLFLQLKHLLEQNYNDKDINFQKNAEIIDKIQRTRYLYEITNYFNEQFDMVIKAIGNSSSDSVIDDILYYIRYNYKSNLKLDTLAPMFGYNSSYLGKVFSKKVGENFNSYVDQVRIAQAKELLLQENLKVYEIAKNVGYKNVDYFHKKFKKYVGISPAEFRNQHNINEQEIM